MQAEEVRKIRKDITKNMKVIFERNALIAAVLPLMGSVSDKNTNVATEGVLISATGSDGCILSAYNMERGMRATLSAQVLEEGSYIVNANKLSQIVRTLPDGDVQIEVNDRCVTKITGGRSVFELHAIRGSEFPNLPDLNIDTGIRLRQGDLKDMIASTFFAMAQDDPRPVMNGSLFEVNGSVLSIVACDGERLALKKKTCEIGTIGDGLTEPMRFVVPGKSLAELQKLLKDPDAEVMMKVTRKHMILSTKNYLLFTRLIEEEYFDYDRFIPKSSKIYVKINCDDFISSLERAVLVTEDRTMGQTKSPLVCCFKENCLEVSSNSVTGSFYDEIPIEKEGDDLKIGFECRNLLDALRACDCTEIKLALTTALMGMVIEPDNDDTENTFLFLVLPVRMQE